ncbi:MAG TPA: signal peptidase I [Armatimonadota bacterium]|jgi:signal peptidase I
MPALVRFLLLLVLLVVVRFCSPYRFILVSGDSMAPTLRSGQLCLVDQRAVNTNQPQRGDVVLADLGGELCVKRILGLPGDSFWLLAPRHFGDFTPLLLGPEPTPTDREMAARPICGLKLVRCVVPPECVYLVGDNRSLSYDSRELGPVPNQALLGRVMAYRPPGRRTPECLPGVVASASSG